MANVLEFLIDIKARLGGSMTTVNRLQQQLNQTGNAADRLNTKMNGLKGIVASLPGGSFLSNPAVLLTAGVGAVAKLGMQVEATAVSFDVLARSEEKSAMLLKDLKKYADENPLLGTSEVNEAAKLMLANSVPYEKVLSSIKAIGDISMGSKDKMMMLTLAYSQIASLGRLQQQDLNQLVQQGFNPLIIIAEKTGKSMKQVKEQMSKGNIPFEMVEAAFKAATSAGGQFYNMSGKLKDTPFGRWSAQMAKAKDVALKLYNVISPLIIPALELLNVLFDTISPFIDQIAKGVKWLVAELKDGNPIMWGVVAAFTAFSAALKIESLIASLATGIGSLITKVRLFSLVLFTSPIGWIALAIGALTAAVIYCWTQFAGFRAFLITMWDTVKNFGVLLKDFVIDRLNELIQGLGNVGSALMKLFKGDFKGALESAKTGAKELFGTDSSSKYIKGYYGNFTGFKDRFDENYKVELIKQADKSKTNNEISDPKATPGIDNSAFKFNNNKDDKSGRGGRASVSTGGVRNTQITINIGKFFDNINVHMMDKADTAEIENMVIESINRGLEIATSAAR